LVCFLKLSQLFLAKNYLVIEQWFGL